MIAITSRRMFFWCTLTTLLGVYTGYIMYGSRGSYVDQSSEFEPYFAPDDSDTSTSETVHHMTTMSPKRSSPNPTSSRPSPADLLETPPSPWDLETSPRDGGIGLPPVWSPRPREEWQGMRVNLRDAPHCEDIPCGLAMACIENRCVACRDDQDCGSGETCVLDHCVLKERRSCTSKDDCDDGELCVLSGYSTGLRGNEEMKAECLSSKEGTPQDESSVEKIDYGTPVPRVVDVESLKTQLVEHVKAASQPPYP